MDFSKTRQHFRLAAGKGLTPAPPKTSSEPNPGSKSGKNTPPKKP